MTQSLTELDLKSLLNLIAQTPIDERYPQNHVLLGYHNALMKHYNSKDTTEEDKSIIVIALNMTYSALLYGYMDYQRKFSKSNYSIKTANDAMPTYVNEFREYQTALKQMLESS